MITPPLPEIQHRSLLACLVGGGIILGLGAALLFLSNWQVDDSAPSYYQPRGYRSNVISMTRSGALRLDPALPGDPNVREWGRLLLDESAASGKEQTFFRQSRRLQRDMEQFNENGGGFFEVKTDGAIGVARDFHNFALPYPRREPWAGSFTLRGDVLPSMVSPELYLGFAEIDEGGAPLASDYAVLTLKEWTKPQGKGTHRRARAYEFRGADGQPLVRFRMHGQQIIMSLVDSAYCIVRLNGEPVNRPGSEPARNFLSRKTEPPINEGNTAPLLVGDRLRIQWMADKTEISFRYGQYSGGIVSRKWMEDGRNINVVDPELAAELPYLAELHEAMNRFVQRHPNPASLKQPDVRLSFDRGLHQSISRILFDSVRYFDARRSSVPNIENEPACVTVLNALTGEVLAMPSYPAPEDLERLHLKSISSPGAGLHTNRLRRLTMNQNLALIPIGSTTKPLLAAAIWDIYPELAKLTLDEPGGERRDLMGYRLSKGYSTVGPRHVDYKGFLRMSSNDYTIHLGLLTLAGKPKLNMDGQPVTTSDGMDFSQFIRGDQIPGGLLRPDLPVFPKFAELFDIALATDFSEDTGARWDPGVLTTLLRQAGVPTEVFSATLPADASERTKITALRDALFNSFANILPEATNLHLDQINSVRGDYTSLLLGSGKNYWSNLKLAEAYARLGTGRRVRARIAVDPKDPAAAENFPELPIRPETLDLIYDGMEECANGVNGSTAERISDSLRLAREKYAKQGLTLRAICKTGTATRISTRRDRSGRILVPKRECAAFCLYLELTNKEGKITAAVSVATYLQDRAATKGDSAPRNSAVAVQLTEDFLPEVLAWLDRQPGPSKVR